jgi:hypothetical protein
VVVPVTVAVKVRVPPGPGLAEPGETETEMDGRWLTFTVARPLLVGSATLVATTWNVPVVEGGVAARPSTVPPPDSWTDQVTAVDCPPGTAHRGGEATAPPVTVATVAGATDAGMLGVCETVTVAWALSEGSAALVAMTWKVPGCRARCSGEPSTCHRRTPGPTR